MTQGSSHGGSTARLSPSLLFRNWRGRVQPLPPGETCGPWNNLAQPSQDSPPRASSGPARAGVCPGESPPPTRRREGGRVRPKRRSPPGSVGDSDTTRAEGQRTETRRDGRGERRGEPSEGGEQEPEPSREARPGRERAGPGRHPRASLAGSPAPPPRVPGSGNSKSVT